MNKLRIWSLFASLKIGGGVERVQANLSTVLSDLGYDFVHILMDDHNPRCEYKGEIINLGIPFVLGFGIKKIWLLFGLAKKVSQICREKNIDILIGQWDFFFMVASLTKVFGNKAKILSVVHTSIWVWSRFVRTVMKRFLKKSDHIVLISEYEKNTFIHKYWFDPKKLTLIYNAIDIDHIKTQSQEPLDSQYDHLFTKSKKTFVNVARLNYQKNQSLLIHAFSRLRDLNTQLLLVGEGDEKENLEKLIVQLGLSQRVFLLGNQKNPHQYIKRSDYWILTSRFEGFPMSMLEAAALGKVIISLDCPTWPREFLDPDGKIENIDTTFVLADNWILVKFESSEEELSQLMDYVLKHDLSQLSKNCENYCQQFDIKTNGIKRQNLIKSL